MKSQMIRVISSPSSSTTGFATLILAMGPLADLLAGICVAAAKDKAGDPRCPGPAGPHPRLRLFRRQRADEGEREAEELGAEGGVGDRLGVDLDKPGIGRPVIGIGLTCGSAGAAASFALPTRYMPRSR